jgi:serine/threonine protein kinase
MLEPAMVAGWAGELCAALDHAHRQGVVHQDVKPHNCLIDRSGKLVLADFGLSRPSTYQIGQTEVFHTRGQGTPGFSAPEQFTGSAPCPAHDVYAFGATLFYLLTGTDIDSGTKAAGGFPDLNALRAGRHRRAAPVDAAWQDAIRRCLMREPRHRPQSMAETAALFGFPAPGPPRRAGWFEKVVYRLTSLFRHHHPEQSGH